MLLVVDGAILRSKSLQMKLVFLLGSVFGCNSFVFHVFKISKTVLVNQPNIIKLRNKQKITSKGIKKSAIPNGEATIK